MKVLNTEIPGVIIIEPDVFGDQRGYFMELWNQRRYAEAGLDVNFVQDNLSYSTRGVLRGLHFQNPNAQGKLVYVLQGEVFDVAVDIRVGSPTFKKWVGVTLSSENKRQFYIPEGFAHGYCVLSETALFAYKCTDLYDPSAEGGIRWDDPGIGIDWPVNKPILSNKDLNNNFLREMRYDLLPLY
jgi:dTDP-4-dehydrorhamnose 3,5-epimerase